MIEPIDKEQVKHRQSSTSIVPRRSTTADSDRFFVPPYLYRVTTMSPGELATPREDTYFPASTGHRKTDPPKIPNHAAPSSSLAAGEPRAHTFDPKALQRDYHYPSVTLALAEAETGVPSSSDKGSKPVSPEIEPSQELSQQMDDQGDLRKDTLPIASSSEQDADKLHHGEQETLKELSNEGWGHSFRIEWIKHTPLPFSRTRHLRNPWNADREVKVSRDGTEVEPCKSLTPFYLIFLLGLLIIRFYVSPAVGLALMAEWDKIDTVSGLSPDRAQATTLPQ